MAREVDGNNILYHYLQKDLRPRNRDLFEALAADLVTSLSIWLPPRVYQRMPILLPWAVRDGKVRGNKRLGLPDQWGAPDQDGRFRDDNSLVKGLPKRLPIRAGSVSEYRGARMGNGFVAAHIWRVRTDGQLATRHHRTYSFVPNVVWLPSQVAKLTDREGSYTQRFLQAISVGVYRSVLVAASLEPFVEEAWGVLEDPGIPSASLPKLEDLSFFEDDEAFFSRRLSATRSVVQALEAIERGEPLNRKVISSRYTHGLPAVAPERRAALHADLTSYVDALED